MRHGCLNTATVPWRCFLAQRGGLPAYQAKSTFALTYSVYLLGFPLFCNNPGSATALAREFLRRFPGCENSGPFLTKNILQLVHSSSIASDEPAKPGARLVVDSESA